jgi:hypothetical protein
MHKDRAIKVAVYRPHEMDSIHIVIYKDWGETMEVLCPIAPVAKEDTKVKWGWVEYDPDARAVEPTFIIPRALDKLAAGGVAKQLVEGFAALGIVPDAIKEQKGLLELKDAHLEDMRHLIFGMDWLNIQQGTPVELEPEHAAVRFQMSKEARDGEVSEDE